MNAIEETIINAMDNDQVYCWECGLKKNTSEFPREAETAEDLICSDCLKKAGVI